MKYWLHRITGGDNALGYAHPLLFAHHYLSIWWSDFSSNAFVRQVQKEGETAIDICYASRYFENIKTAIMVQVKKHEGVTDEWAIQQIKAYMTNHIYDDYHTQMWVISTCEHYSQKAMNEAGVRLISGIEFASMILDTGLEGLNI